MPRFGNSYDRILYFPSPTPGQAPLLELAAVTVAKVRRDVHLPLVALDHELHRLRPALDHLVLIAADTRAGTGGRMAPGAGATEI